MTTDEVALASVFHGARKGNGRTAQTRIVTVDRTDVTLTSSVIDMLRRLVRLGGAGGRRGLIGGGRPDDRTVS
ncbi:hypothetical protein [Cellulomonas sp.]|uniref:hypothetical protein n=1 Tax=Cellulomonas sp. TaxID=40001 RepID=UPI001B0F4821|nr:hypothetical protein [Cellulomonas sp.]MBO9556752.1 hypothetical protein [Cellulomonas sp.]